MHVILDLGPEMAPETIERLASEHAEISILESILFIVILCCWTCLILCGYRILSRASRISKSTITCFVAPWTTLLQPIYYLKSTNVNGRLVVCYPCYPPCEQHKMKQKNANHACQPNTWMRPTKRSFASRSPCLKRWTRLLQSSNKRRQRLDHLRIWQMHWAMIWQKQWMNGDEYMTFIGGISYLFQLAQNVGCNVTVMTSKGTIGLGHDHGFTRIGKLTNVCM